MGEHNRTPSCFVISPIGDETSSIRDHANQLFDYVIEPALQTTQIEVTRADKKYIQNSITSEIINQIQKSSLCIVDLFDLNPNVMYELGRRHETGKPFILLAPKGQKLPFDLFDIHTIFYGDLKEANNVNKVMRELQTKVRELVKSGLDNYASGESLTTMMDFIRKMDIKIDDLISQEYSYQNPDNLDGNIRISKIIKNLSASDAVLLARKRQDLELLEALIPKAKREFQFDTFIYGVVEPAASMGSQLAGKILEDNINKIDKYDSDFVVGYLSSLITYYSKSHQTKEKKDKIIQILDSNINKYKSTDQEIELLNQKSKIWYELEENQKSYDITKKIVELAPRDSIYWYNHYRDCEALNKETEALFAIEKSLELQKDEKEEDADILESAYNLYKKKGQKEKANAILKRIKKVNRYKFELLED